MAPVVLHSTGGNPTPATQNPEAPNPKAPAAMRRRSSGDGEANEEEGVWARP